MGFGAKPGNNSVAALRERAGFGPAKPAARVQPPELRPPPPRPSGKDMSDEQAAKAERIAQLQHETSLLKRAPENDRTKAYKGKKKGGILIQLLLVMVVAGGVAVALDPQLMSQAQAMVDSIDWEDIKTRVGLN
jgi:hypothetical protein